MATQVVIDINEYEELKVYKRDYQKLLDDRLKFTDEKTKELEAVYKKKCEDVDFWIEKLDKKEWRVMFAGWSERKSYFPIEITRTKVWQIVPVKDITWWLRWKTWINK
jgi:hypothetical protein